MADKVVPIVTPFTDDGRTLSEIRIARLIRQCLTGGYSRVFLLGEIGECQSLSTSERKTLVEWISRDAHLQVTFDVHVSSSSTAKSLDLAQHAARHGAHAAVLMPPCLGTYTSQERILHLRTVASYSNIRTIVIDPHMALTDSEKDGLSNIPNLQIADAVSVDCWATQTERCSPLHLFQAFDDGDYPFDWENSIEPLIARYGPSSVAKSALEKMGFDSGSLRSPKLPVPIQELQAVFPTAA